MILAYGRSIHPEKPYANPRVHAIVEDARGYTASFVEAPCRAAVDRVVQRPAAVSAISARPSIGRYNFNVRLDCGASLPLVLSQASPGASYPITHGFPLTMLAGVHGECGYEVRRSSAVGDKVPGALQDWPRVSSARTRRRAKSGRGRRTSDLPGSYSIRVASSLRHAVMWDMWVEESTRVRLASTARSTYL